MKETTITEINYVREPWIKEEEAWSTRSDFFVNLHERADRKEQMVRFMNFLKEHHLLPAAGSKTLDIGCGVGDYALALSKAGMDAYGIDLAEGMIQGAAKLANEENTPLTLFVGPWSEATRNDLDWTKSFDLTYSVFCPVMLDKENLLAMTKTSKGKCLLLAFAERKDTVVDYLHEHIPSKQRYVDEETLGDLINYVRTIGINVEEHYQTAEETEAIELEKAIEYFSLRVMTDFDGTKEELHIKLRKLLRPFTKDGKVHNPTKDRILWLFWEPK